MQSLSSHSYLAVVTTFTGIALSDESLASVLASVISFTGVLFAISFLVASFLLYYRKIVRSRIAPSKSIKDPQTKREKYVKMTNLEKKHDDDLVMESNGSNFSEVIYYEDQVQANKPSKVEEHTVNAAEPEDPQDLSKVIQKYLDRKVQREVQPELIEKPELDPRDAWLAGVPKMLSQEIPEDTSVPDKDSVIAKKGSPLPMEEQGPPLSENTDLDSSNPVDGEFIQNEEPWDPGNSKFSNEIIKVINLEEEGDNEIFNS